MTSRPQEEALERERARLAAWKQAEAARQARLAGAGVSFLNRLLTIVPPLAGLMIWTAFAWHARQWLGSVYGSGDPAPAVIAVWVCLGIELLAALTLTLLIVTVVVGLRDRTHEPFKQRVSSPRDASNENQNQLRPAPDKADDRGQLPTHAIIAAASLISVLWLIPCWHFVFASFIDVPSPGGGPLAGLTVVVSWLYVLMEAGVAFLCSLAIVIAIAFRRRLPFRRRVHRPTQQSHKRGPLRF